MKLLILDTETNAKEHPELIEIACVLYDSDCCSVVQSISTVLPFKKDNEFLKVNRISKELGCASLGNPIFLESIKELMIKSDYCIAYNVDFDKPLIENLLQIYPHWICAMKDFKIPHFKSYPSLVDLALYHDVPILTAHRALNDCLLVAELFSKLYNFQSLLSDAIARSKSPKKKIIAHVSFKEKEKAKEQGFYFDGDTKQWCKIVSELDLKETTKHLTFKWSATEWATAC